MTSVWPISWSYTGVDWPGYATGFAVSIDAMETLGSGGEEQ